MKSYFLLSFDISDTVYTGKNAKELQEKAKQVAETGNILKFFLILKQEGVGTHSIESRARKFGIEKASKEGGKKGGPGSKGLENEKLKSSRIEIPRNEDVVKDLLEIKIKAAVEAKDTSEKEFSEMWTN